MRTLITTIIGTIAPATAFAAEHGLREDNSGIMVWAFLALCALIVVAQVVPAVLLATGMTKGMVAVAKGEKTGVKAHN